MFPVVLSLLLAANTNASSSGVRNQTPTIKEELRNLTNDATTPGQRKDLMGTAKPTLKAVLDNAKRETIRSFFNRMIKRFEAAIARLTTLSDRIESRIKKLEADGKNMTAEKALLASGRNHIKLAQDKLESAKADLETSLNSQTPKDTFKDVKQALSDTKNHLKLAHADLVKIITTIKGLRLGTDKNATGSAVPTATVTPITTATPSATPTI